MKPSRTVLDGRTFDVGPAMVRGMSPAAKLLVGLLGCLLVFGVFRGADAQENWTRFRGPDGTGIADAPSIPAAFDEKDYRWQTALPGSGHSSPVLWGDKIFLTCRIE